MDFKKSIMVQKNLSENSIAEFLGTSIIDS